MAELSTLARPYAKAAFEYAREKNALTSWSEQLALAAAVTVDSAMAGVLANPSMTAEQQSQTVSDVCGEALDAELRNYVGILASN